MLYNLFLTTDGVPHPENAVAEMQNKLLWHVFSDLEQSFIDDISFHEPTGAVCEWVGIHCSNGLITQLRYTKKSVGNFNIPYLPPTLTCLSLCSCEQCYSIQTRSLPRNLKTITMEKNHIYGHIDLQTLPPTLEMLYLKDNKITGPLDFTQLPREMKAISLSTNRIRQKVILYDDLPRNLRSITLWGNKGIGEIRPLEPHEDSKKPTIFQGIEKSCIF